MTGPREAGVLLGQARMRDARKKSLADRETLALERIAEALEGLEVSMAVIADAVEAECYLDPDGEAEPMAFQVEQAKVFGEYARPL